MKGKAATISKTGILQSRKTFGYRVCVVLFFVAWLLGFVRSSTVQWYSVNEVLKVTLFTKRALRHQASGTDTSQAATRHQALALGHQASGTDTKETATWQSFTARLGNALQSSK